jgi:serine/threonine protein kinase/Tol biopolymer transport system component
MTIEPGSHIGPYEVVSQLGEGGMGVVYRGRDARLQRDVALKLLPEHFASDPDRLSRFQREAQLLASLNHPNIAQIYGLEQVGDSVCIVMELVEGQTLEERLKTGPMAFSEIQDVAKQMADALAAAHERGIVHRDLKPANIKLTPSGVVKILDFGLAKAVGQQSSAINASTLPTMATGSITGAIVGTPGYMSPEQARGKDVDARTDIWAFGCVLYEMLTGRQAFGGETLMDVMAKVVTAPPDLEFLPKDTPSALRMLLSATLNKSVPQRLQHIGDSRLFLDPGFLQVPAAIEVSQPQQSKVRGKLAVGILAIALVILAVPAFLYFRSSPRAAQKMVFEVSFPNLVGNAAAISPQGDAFAYIGQPPDNKRTLWIRPLNSETPVQLSGTDDVTGFLWLPGGQALVFISADGKLRRIERTGGSSRVLADTGSGFRGLTANRNGVILGARVSDNIIVQISESGEVKPVTSLDASSKELFQALPVFLPDGNRFVYISVRGEQGKMGLYVGSLDAPSSATQVWSFVPNNLNNMHYVPSGHLLMLQAGTLTAVPMDASGQVEEGGVVTLAEGLTGNVSVSENGMLLYRKAGPPRGMNLVWFSRDGKQSEPIGETAEYGGVEISPQGDRAAIDIVANNTDIWVMDLSRGVPTRITHDRARDWSPSFSSDGRQLVFASAGRDEFAAITQSYMKSSSGLGQEVMIPGNDESSIVVDWSPDGKTLVLSRSKTPNGTQPYDTWIQPATGGKPTPYLQTPFDKTQGQVSPDGKWLAYSTNESGTYQIVVQSFPDPAGAKSTITAEGGVEPKWRRDGKELYYLAFDGKMMAVPVMGGATFEVGRPIELFQTPLSVNRTQPVRTRRYDVAPDGRFLIVTPEGERAQAPMTFVVNWPSGLKP